MMKKEASLAGSLANPLSLNFYTYAENNPVMYVDPTGHVVETALDAASLSYSTYQLATNPSWVNAGYLAWDVAATAVPFAPGSYVGRVAQTASKTFNLGKILRQSDKGILYEGVTKRDGPGWQHIKWGHVGKGQPDKTLFPNQLTETQIKNLIMTSLDKAQSIKKLANGRTLYTYYVKSGGINMIKTIVSPEGIIVTSYPVGGNTVLKGKKK
jgi:hypothetical protein